MPDILLTPRQAAVAAGVSESSARRWCDQERLAIERTPGGHRRIRLSALVKFARENGIQLDVSAALGTRGRGGKQVSLDDLLKRVYACATVGDEAGLRGLIADAVGAGNTLASVCDDLLAPVLHRVGEEWSTGALDVFQEHCTTECILDALAMAKDLLPVPDRNAPLALSCALGQDVYAVAPRMASLVTREAGFRTAHLGPNTPTFAIQAALGEFRPALLTISLSYAADESQTIRQLRTLGNCCRKHDAYLAVGGRALNDRVRRAIKADFFGDTMEHLSNFATGLHRRRAGLSAG